MSPISTALLIAAVSAGARPLVACPWIYDDARGVVHEWEEGRGSGICTRRFAEAHPDIRADVAVQIATSARSRRGMEEALELLEEAPAEEAARAYLALVKAAGELGDPELSARAAEEQAFHAEQGKASGPPEEAAKAFGRHRYEEAARGWEAIAFAQPASLRTVERAVDALRRLGPTGAPQIQPLCQTLLAHGRTAQAMACLRSAPAAAISDQLRLEVYGAQPVLTVEDIHELQEHRPALEGALAEIRDCASAGAPASSAPLVGGKLPLAAIYGRLADGLESDGEGPPACLIRAASNACVAELVSGGTCSAPRSIGRAVDLVAADPRELSDLIHRSLRVLFRDWTREDPKAFTALFNMHASLAYALSRNPLGTASEFSPAYHVEQARRYWAEIGHGAPLPPEVLVGVNAVATPEATAVAAREDRSDWEIVASGDVQVTSGRQAVLSDRRAGQLESATLPGLQLELGSNDGGALGFVLVGFRMGLAARGGGFSPDACGRPSGHRTNSLSPKGGPPVSTTLQRAPTSTPKPPQEPGYQDQGDGSCPGLALVSSYGISAIQPRVHLDLGAVQPFAQAGFDFQSLVMDGGEPKTSLLSGVGIDGRMGVRLLSFKPLLVEASYGFRLDLGNSQPFASLQQGFTAGVVFR